MNFIKAPLLFFVIIFLSIFYLSEAVFAKNNFDLKRNQTNADSIKLDYVFKNGDDGYLCYRIPGIITTNKGTLLAFAEGRKNHCGDAGDIDLIVKRSENGGKTWGPLLIIWSDSTNTCGNPSPVLDKETGKIFLLSTWNRGEDHEKQIIDLSSKDTRRVFILSSDNDGKAWSSAREITSSVKHPDWTWYATGPCHGIQILNGKYKGRLVVPVNHIEKGTNKDYASIIYSDDHGVNWKSGNNTPQDMVNESTVAELSKGKLMMNMRNYDKNIRTRQVSISSDGGLNWGNVYTDTALIEPICQATLLRYPLKGKKYSLLFSNPASKTTRTNMTVRLSKNGGKTWTYSKTLYKGPSAYSDMTVIPGGDIACFFEAGLLKPYEGIVFKRVKYQELINSKE